MFDCSFVSPVSSTEPTTHNQQTDHVRLRLLVRRPAHGPLRDLHRPDDQLLVSSDRLFLSFVLSNHTHPNPYTQTPSPLTSCPKLNPTTPSHHPTTQVGQVRPLPPMAPPAGPQRAPRHPLPLHAHVHHIRARGHVPGLLRQLVRVSMLFGLRKERGRGGRWCVCVCVTHPNPPNRPLKKSSPPPRPQALHQRGGAGEMQPVLLPGGGLHGDGPALRRALLLHPEHRHLRLRPLAVHMCVPAGVRVAGVGRWSGREAGVLSFGWSHHAIYTNHQPPTTATGGPTASFLSAARSRFFVAGQGRAIPINYRDVRGIACYIPTCVRTNCLCLCVFRCRRRVVRP